MLICFHDIVACDTATDDSIAFGILSNSKIIVISPCCHHEIKKQMNKTFKENKSDISTILQYNILRERQAEMITDSIRLLVLEYFSYETNIIEFIDLEHTSKNLLITAIKRRSLISKEKQSSILTKIKSLIDSFEISEQSLLKLMEIKFP